MSNLKSADSSDDVNAVIENIAAPVGSYSIKNNLLFTIAVNGYTGGYYSENFSMMGDGGLTAPIGLSVSTNNLFGMNCLCKTWGCWVSGVFISVVDIGNYLAPQFENPNTEMVGDELVAEPTPEIYLHDIFFTGHSP